MHQNLNLMRILVISELWECIFSIAPVNWQEVQDNWEFHITQFSKFCNLTCTWFHFLHKTFGDNNVLPFSTVPPQSPNIYPCNFFLWGFLNKKLLMKKSSTVMGLRALIIQPCCTLSEDLHHKVGTNTFMLKRSWGRLVNHIEHVPYTEFSLLLCYSRCIT